MIMFKKGIHFFHRTKIMTDNDFLFVFVSNYICLLFEQRLKWHGVKRALLFTFSFPHRLSPQSKPINFEFDLNLFTPTTNFDYYNKNV